METEILKQWQQSYPCIPQEVVSAFGALLDKALALPVDQSGELAAAAGGLMTLLEERFGLLSELQALVEQYEQAQQTAEQFRQALGKELTAREVPEAFWQAAVAVDALTGEVISSADAIQASYKAYLQQQSDEKVDVRLRPQQADQAPKISPAVENFLRSRRSDAPLAGRLKG